MVLGATFTGAVRARQDAFQDDGDGGRGRLEEGTIFLRLEYATDPPCCSALPPLQPGIDDPNTTQENGTSFAVV